MLPFTQIKHICFDVKEIETTEKILESLLGVPSTRDHHDSPRRRQGNGQGLLFPPGERVYRACLPRSPPILGGLPSHNVARGSTTSVSRRPILMAHCRGWLKRVSIPFPISLWIRVIAGWPSSLPTEQAASL